MKNKKKFDWGNIGFILGYHLLLFISLPVYCIFFSPPSWTFLILATLGLLTLCGISITGGYHRLFSHKTYKTRGIVKFFYLFFGTLATQGSALRWSHDHRLHHAHIDKDQDPYAVKDGFWHAHILWMFKKRPPIQEKIVSDLLRDKMIKFQDKYYNYLMLGTNIFMTIFLGFCSGTFLGAFIFTWLLRLFLLHHFTWFINSLAHYWGHQNYSTEHSAVDNYVISILTWGEGYHNFHHTFASDYRNGIKWYHFDPTKWLIWTLSKLGLASNLRKISDRKVLSQTIEEHKKILLNKIQKSALQKKEDFTQYVNKCSNDLLNHLNDLQEIMQRKSTQSKEWITKESKRLRRALKKDWRLWRRCSKQVFRLKEAA